MKKKFAAFILCVLCLLSLSLRTKGIGHCGRIRANNRDAGDRLPDKYQRNVCGAIPGDVKIRVPEYLDRCRHTAGRR